jgi:hypothetical protein
LIIIKIIKLSSYLIKGKWIYNKKEPGFYHCLRSWSGQAKKEPRAVGWTMRGWSWLARFV